MTRVCGKAGARVGALLLAWVAVASPGAARAQSNEIQTLAIAPLVRDDRVLVSLDLANGFTEEVRAAIRSGLETTYTYTVELRLAVPLWVDRTMGVATVTSSVEYDNLRRVFELERRVDGRLEETLVTGDEAVVRRWMTSLEKLPLFRTSTLEPNREYYLRVSATARPSNGSLLWPFSSGTSAQAKFTFLR